MHSSKLILSSALVLAVVLMAFGESATAMPSAAGAESPSRSSNNNDEEPLPMGSLFLTGTDCGPNEELAPGSLPTCEPTCENPRPVCPKVFFSSLDYVPCFCKSPMVRNVKTKQCVQLSECPKN